ncbi:MAG TPA: pentapeptide repeat-containing protein [Ktedonobacteraceae bacterium]|jgi:hypothetical protein|nr:pentapeptide repeat-containing protein [Ktedonobacteraceae bacterium]
MATGNLKEDANSSSTPIWIPPLSPRAQQRINQQRTWQQRRHHLFFVLSGGFKDKTLWDYLQLVAVLAIPVFIAFGTLYFTNQQNQASAAASAAQSQSAAAASEMQHQTDLSIAQDQQQETALQTYLDRMSGLLFTEHLATSQPGDEVRQVARARTLTLLPQLNGTRKGEVLQFLYETGLLVGNEKVSPVISLRNANLRGADLSEGNLGGVDLGGIDLAGADLAGANLAGIFLGRADLFGTNLEKTNLEGTILGSDNLTEANLSYANLKGADLKGANLSYANLLGVVGVTSQQLNTAFSLAYATMPDGLMHP